MAKFDETSVGDGGFTPAQVAKAADNAEGDEEGGNDDIGEAGPVPTTV